MNSETLKNNPFEQLTSNFAFTRMVQINKNIQSWPFFALVKIPFGVVLRMSQFQSVEKPNVPCIFHNVHFKFYVDRYVDRRSYLSLRMSQFQSVEKPNVPYIFHNVHFKFYVDRLLILQI